MNPTLSALERKAVIEAAAAGMETSVNAVGDSLCYCGGRQKTTLFSAGGTRPFELLVVQADEIKRRIRKTQIELWSVLDKTPRDQKSLILCANVNAEYARAILVAWVAAGRVELSTQNGVQYYARP